MVQRLRAKARILCSPQQWARAAGQIGGAALPRVDQEPDMSTEQNQIVASVRDALGDTPEQAANLRARADLMTALRDIVQREGWTQADAASRCGVTQPRMNELLRGRISKFSIDALVNMAAAAGQRVHLVLAST
jgi:predicted XRE-type DNA-binding protein